MKAHFQAFFPEETKERSADELCFHSAHDGRAYLDVFRRSYDEFEVRVTTGDPRSTTLALKKSTERIFRQLARQLRSQKLRPSSMYYELTVDARGLDTIVTGTPRSWRRALESALRDDLVPKMLVLASVALLGWFVAPNKETPWLSALVAAVGAIVYSIGLAAVRSFLGSDKFDLSFPGDE